MSLSEKTLAALDEAFGLNPPAPEPMPDPILQGDALDTRSGIGASLEQHRYDLPSPLQDAAYLRSFEGAQDDEWSAIRELTPQEEAELNERKSAAFRLNHIGDNPQEEVLQAFDLAKKLNMPFDMTLRNYKTAWSIASEFNPGKMSADHQRLWRHISENAEAAQVWRHDFDTAVQIAESVKRRDAEAWSNGFDPAMVYGQSEYLLDEQGTGAAIRRVVEKAGPGMTGGFASLLGAIFNYLPSETIVEDGEGNDVRVQTDFGSVEDYFGKVAHDAYAKVREINKRSPQQGRIWDNPELLKNPAYMVEMIGDAAMSMVPMLIATFATGGGALGIAAGGLVGGAMEAGPMYDELIREGIDKDKAATWSGVYGVMAAALDALGLKGILGSGGSFFRRVAVAGASEGGTEWLQELTQAGLESVARGETFRQGVDRVIDAMKNVESFIAGGVLGGGLGVGHARSEIRTERLRDAWKKALGSEAVTSARNAFNNITRDADASQSRLALGETLNGLAAAADTSSTRAANQPVFEDQAAQLLDEDQR
ncbi:MAG: hypothetical protein LBB60_10615, partial [Desulfovibrio sp.]|nr:hypothetical protein [Desulfovibrio sp.]